MKAKKIIKAVSVIGIAAVSALIVYKLRKRKKDIGFTEADDAFVSFLFDEPDDGCIAPER